MLAFVGVKLGIRGVWCKKSDDGSTNSFAISFFQAMLSVKNRQPPLTCDQFLNQALAGNPLFPGIMPLCAFAVTTSIPQEWGSVSRNIIDPKDRTIEYFDFESLYSQGVVLLSEVKVDTNFFDKPGEHHIGAMWKHGNMLDPQFSTVLPEYPYPPLPPTCASKSDASAIYYGFDQYLRVFDGSGAVPKGWGLFGRAGIADGGTGTPNFSAWTTQVGIGGDTGLRNRQGKGDRWGIGYNYTGTSSEWGPIPRALFGPRDSQAVELYYRYHLRPFVEITPDVLRQTTKHPRTFELQNFDDEIP